MLTAESPASLHLLQNLSLIALSLLFLPLSTLVLLFTYPLYYFLPHHALLARRHNRRSPGFRQRTILVTGVGMSKGLALARDFYLAGHVVIGADFEANSIPACGRFSRSLQRFYALTKPNADDVVGVVRYIEQLLRIVRKERVDLWVSCSGVASAVEDGQAREIIEQKTDCRAIQFDVHETATLHEKASFIRHTENLGLPVPETHDVQSRDAVHKVLNGGGAGKEASRRKKRYIMKSVSVDDAQRGNMTLLPRRTLSETYSHISRIPISKDKPWVLQEFIKGPEYCTHALVIGGKVKAFVACPSAELLMHYEALQPEDGLSKAMEQFTKEFARRSGADFTGHLSFDFMVEERVRAGGLEKVILPIECNPRCHTAVVLFNAVGSKLAKMYESAMDQHATMNANGLLEIVNGYREVEQQQEFPLYPQDAYQYYWVGHDLVKLGLLPTLDVLRLKRSIWSLLDTWRVLFTHLIFWKDGTMELWDPMPWFALYHLYWPGQFAASIWHKKRWSRVNVSTTKMFAC